MLDYINQNKIVIEEVNYCTDEALSSIQSEFDELTEALGGYGEAFDEMANRYGDDFKTAIWYDEVGQLHFEDGYEDYGNYISDYHGINETRLNYTTDFLDNKREIALVVPTIDPYNAHDEIHFGDAGGGRAVAWVRFGETTDAEGNRVLVIDEIQSKRHQDGREKGYIPTIEKQIALAEDAYNDAKNKYEEAESKHSSLNENLLSKYGIGFEGITDAELQELRTAYENLKLAEETLRIKKDALVRVSNGERGKSVPDAPFEKNWHELAMKRMLRYAAENGYDKVAWTTGEQQAERYDLSKVVESIDYRMDTDGTILIDTYGSHGYQIESVPTHFKNEAEIAEVFGKEIANTIVLNLNAQQEKVEALNQKLRGLKPKMKEVDVDSVEYDNLVLEFGEISREKHEAQKMQTIEGEDLRIGGEGMKGFYDKMLPSFMNKYGKKWGVKVGEVTMPDVGDKGLTMHSVDVNDAMRESVMEGQPMFREREEDKTTKTTTDTARHVPTATEGYSDAEVSMANDPIAKVMGKSQRTKAQQAKFAERERKAMRNRVAELTEKMGIGDRVEVIEGGEATPSPLRGTPPIATQQRESELSQRKARAKGWFDPRTGKIVINLSNHTSVADVERTLLHEAVAHYGLRELFGGQFDTFLDNVYNNAEGEIKAQIDALASSKGVSTRVATEEYLAGLAEDTNFEYLERQTSFWQKLKQLFMDMLESIGWNYKGPELSDNELRYILWRSYENMVNPGRHRSILGMAEDVVMREKFGIGTPRVTTPMSQVAESAEVYSETPTAEEAVAAYKAQFGGIKDLDVVVFNNAVDAYKYELENGVSPKEARNEVRGIIEKEMAGGYDAERKKIYIFAFNDVNAYTTLFHEHVHYAIERLGGVKRIKTLVEELDELDPQLRQKGIDQYNVNEIDEEIITYSLEAAMYGGAIDELAEALSPKAQWQLRAILQLTGYEKGRDYKREAERYDPAPADKQFRNRQTRTRRRIAERDRRRGRMDNQTNEGGSGVQEMAGQNTREPGGDGASREEPRGIAGRADEGVLFRDGESDGTREEYDKRVKTTAKRNPKLALTTYNFKEAFVNELESVRILQDIVEKKYGIKLRSFENALNAENRLSSVNLREFEDFLSGIYEDMMSYSDKWIKKGGETQGSINRYMIAKSGLERNREFTVRDAINARLNSEEEDKRISVKDADKWRKEYEAKYREIVVADKENNKTEAVKKTSGELLTKTSRQFSSHYAY